MNFQEAMAAWQAHEPMHALRGVVLPQVRSYTPTEWKRDFNLAMDAQAALSTDPNSGIPAFLTTSIDPDVIKVLFSPMKAAIILGEKRAGTWLDETRMFPIVEHTGEVSSYGDFNENGRAGANTNWPQRQSYLYQTIEEYGERELERAGLARINWVSEVDQSAAEQLNRFQNLSYFFGIAGLQNYGLLNDPNLSAALTPATKTAGGTRWITAGGVINATANEIYADIQALFIALVAQSGGLIDQETPMTMALSPTSATALLTTNSFGVNVTDLLKKNLPKIKVETAVQYAAQSASNPNGVVAGNEVQLIADRVESQQTGFAAFNEKMRSHTIVKALSSFKKKLTAGTWGAVIRQPVGIASMVGI